MTLASGGVVAIPIQPHHLGAQHVEVDSLTGQFTTSAMAMASPRRRGQGFVACDELVDRRSPQRRAVELDDLTVPDHQRGSGHAGCASPQAQGRVGHTEAVEVHRFRVENPASARRQRRCPSREPFCVTRGIWSPLLVLVSNSVATSERLGSPRIAEHAAGCLARCAGNRPSRNPKLSALLASVMFAACPSTQWTADGLHPGGHPSITTDVAARHWRLLG